MKRVILFLGTVMLGAVLFVLLVSGVGWQEIWEALRMLSLAKVFGIFLLTWALLGVGLVRWHTVLQGQGIPIPFPRLWSAYLGGFSLLFLLPIIPFGGELFRSSALKAEHGVALPKGMASVVIDRILEVTSNLLIVTAGGIIFLLLGESAHYSIKSAGVAVFIIVWLALFVLLYERLFKSKSVIRVFWKKGKYVAQVEGEVFAFFSLRNAFFWRSLALSFLRSGIGLVRAWVLILFLGKGIAVLPGITILAFYYLGILIPIPAALGPLDALQIVGFQAFGLGAGTGAAFALVIRSVEILFAGVGLLLVFQTGWHMIRDALLQKERSLVKVFSHHE